MAAYFPQLTPEELVRRNRASNTVWENCVQWVRLRLAQKGQLADWREVRRQGIWRITDEGRQRLEKEWVAFHQRLSSTPTTPANTSTQSEPGTPEDRRLHTVIQSQLQEIGATLGKFSTTEYREMIYRYDVVWKDSEHIPRVTHCFEVQHRGNVVEALAKLKHALDIWGSRLFIVITGEKDRQKVRQLLAPYLAGVFHEIATSITVLTYRVNSRRSGGPSLNFY